MLFVRFALGPVGTAVPMRATQGGQRRWCQKAPVANRSEKYGRLAKQEGFRARSAYKLLELDAKYHLFTDETRCVVDLGSAPGSWLQVARDKMSLEREDAGAQKKYLIGIDKRPLEPLTGVRYLRGDFTDPATQAQLRDMIEVAAEEMGARRVSADTVVQQKLAVQAASLAAFSSGDMSMHYYGKTSQTLKELRRRHEELLQQAMPQSVPVVDGVLSDMANNIVYETDDHIQVQLAEQAKFFALSNLREGGFFVCKIYGTQAGHALYRSLGLYFKNIALVRPPAVRKESRESFAVAKNFIGMERVMSHEYAPISEEALEALGSSEKASAIRSMLSGTNYKKRMLVADPSSYKANAKGKHITQGRRLSKHIKSGAPQAGMVGDGSERETLLAMLPNTR
eukprot:Rhum_TRINITY_DN17136_c0_g1::Rhum_TRINITY_DN17136_c0_g1_i1::g.165358::m.165358